MPYAKFFRFSSVIFLCILLLILLKNITYYQVPNSDFFSYLNETGSLLHGKVPYRLKFSPVYPTVMIILSKFYPNAYPELMTGIIINCLLLPMTIILLWKILYPYLSYLSILPILMFLSNSLTYYVSLQPINMSMFTFIVLLVIYLRFIKHHKIAYFLASGAFFIRYEGILLFLSLVIIDSIKHRVKKSMLVVYTVLTLLPILGWELIIHYNNLLQNEYVYELMQRATEIPNYRFITYTVTAALLNLFSIKLSLLLWVFIIGYLLMGLIILWKKSYESLCLMTIFTVLYLITHLFFPDASNRYAYPIMWFLYVVFLLPLVSIYKTVPQKTFFGILLLIISILLIGHNILNIHTQMSLQYERTENRLVADWLNSQTFTKPTKVITSQRSIVDYFTYNNQVVFPYVDYKLMNDCTFEQVIPYEQQLIVIDSYTHSATGYSASKSGADCFQTFEEDHRDAQPIAVLTTPYRWAKIYRYEKNR